MQVLAQVLAQDIKQNSRNEENKTESECRPGRGERREQSRQNWTTIILHRRYWGLSGGLEVAEQGDCSLVTAPCQFSVPGQADDGVFVFYWGPEWRLNNSHSQNREQNNKLVNMCERREPRSDSKQFSLWGERNSFTLVLISKVR